MTPRWVAVAMVGVVAACQSPWSPLTSPLPADRMVPRGLRVAIARDDLGQMAETIRVLAGKQVEFAAPPHVLPGSGLVLGGYGSKLLLADPKASWLDDGQLQWQVAVPPMDVALALGQPNQPACAVHWQAAGATATLQAHVVAKTGRADVALTSQPVVAFDQPHLHDSAGCLEALPPGVVAAVEGHVRQTVQDALVPPLGGAVVKALRTAIPPSLAVSGQVPLGDGASGAGQLRLQTAFLGGASPQVERQGTLAVAPLVVAADADRAACAVDVPPPQAVASLLVKPAVVPSSAPLLRRALVVDAAWLDQLGWLWARAGGFCRRGTTTAATALDSQWAAGLAPALAPWLDNTPPRFRLWPHASPVIDLAEDHGVPLLGWTLADATLEVIADVGGVEAVVLAIRGRIHGQWRVVAGKGSSLQLIHHSGGIDSALVSSPLRSDLAVTAPAAALTQLVDAALQGMLEPAASLSLEGWLPAGTVITATAQTGQDLWLWLDGGLQP